jgi:hypothetical protein
MIRPKAKCFLCGSRILAKFVEGVTLEKICYDFCSYFLIYDICYWIFLNELFLIGMTYVFV